MSNLTSTPKPPYYAVIFASVKSNDLNDYSETAERMMQLAQAQPGFLGVDSASSAIGITVSYWSDIDSIKAWKQNAEHQEAQAQGKDRWYSAYTTRIAKVEHEYGSN